MSDFCQQCAIDTFEYDTRDLANLGNGKLEPGEGYLVICEGCGPTLVDNEGRCINPDCWCFHGTK